MSRSVKAERKAFYIGQSAHAAKLGRRQPSELGSQSLTQLRLVRTLEGIMAEKEHLYDIRVSLTHPSGRPCGVKAVTPADGEFACQLTLFNRAQLKIKSF